MVDVVVLVAFALLVLGVVGSVVPSLPGALLSLAGVLLYWWSTGYTEPGTLLLIVILAVVVMAALVDILAGFLAAKAGGASTLAATLAGVAGFLAFFVIGPIGMLIAVAATVFVVEVARGGDTRDGIRSAAMTTVGVMGSAVIQAVFTGTVLLAMLAIALL